MSSVWCIKAYGTTGINQLKRNREFSIIAKTSEEAIASLQSDPDVNVVITSITRKGPWGWSTDMKMDAYHYGFEPTGVQEIDFILCAVASAGKAFHNTSQWNDDVGEFRYNNVTGDTPVDWIQNAANHAASNLKDRSDGQETV